MRMKCWVATRLYALLIKLLSDSKTTYGVPEGSASVLIDLNKKKTMSLFAIGNIKPDCFVVLLELIGRLDEKERELADKISQKSGVEKRIILRESKRLVKVIRKESERRGVKK